MQETNPYQPPQAVAHESAAQLDLSDVESGQKLVIYAILVNFAAAPLQRALHPLLAAPVFFLAVGMALLGVVRLSRGLAWSTGARIALVVLMFVPLVNLVTLLVVNSRANRVLRNAGYTIGLLGASKKA